MNQTHSTSDEKLVRRFTAGDVEAFEALVVKYQKPIVNFIYRMIGDFQEAEDIAQEVFIRVYQFIHNYEGRSTFATWLCGIASNLCRDSLRVSSHWDLVFLDARKETIREQLLGESREPSPQSHSTTIATVRFQRKTHRHLEEIHAQR